MRAVDVGEVPVAILAGGLATRLGPVAGRIPKALVEVAGRPFIAHQLARLREAGIRRVVLCLGHLGEQVEAYVGDGAAHGLAVRYSYDGPTLLGTAGALRRAETLLGEVFWVLYGDAYLEVDYRAVLAELERRGGLGIMLVLRNENQWDRSNVVFRDGRLVRYDKARPTPDMTHIDYGAAILRKTALARVPSDRPCDLADVYRDLVDEGLLSGYEVTRRFYEVGSPAGLVETQRYLEGRLRQSFRPPLPRWVGEGAGGRAGGPDVVRQGLPRRGRPHRREPGPCRDRAAGGAPRRCPGARRPPVRAGCGRQRGERLARRQRLPEAGRPRGVRARRTTWPS